MSVPLFSNNTHRGKHCENLESNEKSGLGHSVIVFNNVTQHSNTMFHYWLKIRKALIENAQLLTITTEAFDVLICSILCKIQLPFQNVLFFSGLLLTSLPVCIGRFWMMGSLRSRTTGRTRVSPSGAASRWGAGSRAWAWRSTSQNSLPRMWTENSFCN